MQLDNTKNEMETNNGNTGGQKQRENTIQKLIENMIMESNYEHSKLNKDEKNQIIKSLESIDINKDWHSKGSEGVIFKIQIKDKNGKIKEYIAAKKRYDNDPDNEWKIHKKVEDIIKDKMPNSIVKTPELKAVITLPNQERFIIMEFVNGKTLYQLELEEIFKKWNIPTGEIKSDIEAEGLFFKILNLSPINPNDMKKGEKRYYEETKNIKLFTPKQGNEYKTELKKFLQEIHKEGIYHRDGSNPRNIMITDNGQIYIIDFGKSKWIKNKNVNEEHIYEKQEGENMIGVHPRDEEILTEIAGLTKTNDDIKREQEITEQKKEIIKIKSDKSVFEYIKHVPESRCKNPKKIEIIKQKIQEQIKKTKKIEINQMEETKNKEELITLILAQSYRNMLSLMENITTRKEYLEDLVKKAKEKQINIPVYTLALNDNKAIEDHKKYYEKTIQKTQKQIKKLDNIKEKIIYLQKII